MKEPAIQDIYKHVAAGAKVVYENGRVFLECESSTIHCNECSLAIFSLGGSGGVKSCYNKHRAGAEEKIFNEHPLLLFCVDLI